MISVKIKNHEKNKLATGDNRSYNVNVSATGHRTISFCAPFLYIRRVTTSQIIRIQVVFKEEAV